MGYYTYYELSIIKIDNNNSPKRQIHTILNEIINNDFKDYNPFEEACKWYDWESDMINLSKKYPNILFCLDGNGEEDEDLWRCYFKDGKSQFCKAIISYDEYDENKLK